MTAIASHGADRFGPWWRETRAMLALGWPLVLTNLAQMAITTTDVVMMGWLGPDSLAAGILGVNLVYAVFVFGIGISMAAAPLLAQERGSNRFAVREIRRTVRQSLWASLAVGVAGWMVLWHAEAILLALGQRPDLAAAAATYVRAMQWGTVPFYWFLVLRAFIATYERPTAGFVITGAAILLNAVVDWVLIFGKFGLPALGLMGAGIASTLANTFMFVALLAFVAVDRRFRRYRLLGRFWRADWPRFREVWRIGLPVGLTMLFEVSVFNAAVVLMGWIDASAIAAHAIAIQIAAVTFMVPMGFAQATTVRVGLAAGAGDAAAVARAGWVGIALGGGFMACTAVLLIAAPGALARLFLDAGNPASLAVLPLATTFIAIAGAFQIADGLQCLGAGALRGLKDTRAPMLFAGVGYWVLGLPTGAALAFGAGWGGAGIWIGLATGLAIVAALLIGRWTLRERFGLTVSPAGAVSRRGRAGRG